MSNRHLSRTIALQTLFEWDFHHRSKKLFDLLVQNQKSFAPDFDDQGFTEKLVKGVTRHLDEIDALIQKFAPEWPIDQITLVDRNILRIGIYELKFDDHMPPRVAINESIELAKAFGGESSYRFVNGVLGAIFKNENISDTPSGAASETDYAAAPPIPQEISAGGVLFRQTAEGPVFVLIKDAINKWTFPKGKIGDVIKNEDILDTVRREIQEETGIVDCTILGELGSIDITVNPPGKTPYPKRVFYYLVETTDTNLHPEDSVTVKDAQWFTADEVMQQLGYENAKELFKHALTKLT